MLPDEGKYTGGEKERRVRIYMCFRSPARQGRDEDENDVSDASFDLGSADIVLLTGSFH